MRILLAFIVVLNLLYVGWEFINPADVKPDVSHMAENLKTLELLHEERIKNLKRGSAEVSENEELASPEVDVAKIGLSCYTLGPFKDKEIMQQMRESMAQYVKNISVRKRQQSVKHRYWVYVPALADRKQAKFIGKKLRQKKLDDFYIVLSGGAKNSISLGHFREPKHANRRMKQVAELGFNAQIKVIYREYDIYWLDYQVGADFSVDEYVSDGVSQLERDC
jgi:sporulation related protein